MPEPADREPPGHRAPPGRAGAPDGAADGRPAAGGRAGPPGRAAPEPPPEDAPGDDPAKDAGPDEDDEPAKPSVDDELNSLRDRSGDEDDEVRDDIQANLIAEEAVRRLGRDPSGKRIQNVQIFNAGVTVGEGFNFMAASGGITPGARGLRRVDPKRLAALIETYLRPSCFEEALQVLWERRLLVLAIRQGTGRQAAALNLLAEVLALNDEDGDDAGACFQVTDLGTIADADWRPPSKGSGYVVLLDGPAASGAPRARLSAEAVDEHWLAGIADRLEETRSFMVVVTGVPRGALVEAAIHSGHVVTSLGELDMLRIVERHVLGETPDPARRSELHHRLTASEALTLLTAERPEPQTAVRVATAIRDGEDLARVVAELRDPTGQVHMWFNQNRDTENLCMAIAAAVLEDGAYLAFSDAAVKLHEALVARTGAPPDLRLWEQLSAGHPWFTVEFGDGRASTPPRVRFHNPLVQQAVLGYMWTYLDGRRPAILGWLRDLVGDPDVGVRARAAVAAGVIAWNDHGHAVHRFLRPWARDSSPALRRGAAIALAVAGSNPDLTDAIWRLIESWAPADVRLASTAVTAVGGSLGGARPERALKLIRTALDRESWDTVLPAARSVARLIELGGVQPVLDALLDWSQPQDSSPMVVKALAVFVTAVCEPPAEVDEEYAGMSWPGAPEDGAPPPLLKNPHEHLTRLAELWARALARRPAQSYALELLRVCLDTYADRDHATLRGVTAILREVAARPGRHRDRLEWYLGDWAADTDRPSTSAGHIRDALTRRGDPRSKETGHA